MSDAHPDKNCGQYRKKPVVIEAAQWFELGDHPNVTRSWSAGSDYRCPKCGQAWGKHGEITTLESKPDGAHHVCPGDWIITGVKGEHYACKPDIFAQTYEPATDAERVVEAERRRDIAERVLKMECAPSHARLNGAMCPQGGTCDFDPPCVNVACKRDPTPFHAPQNAAPQEKYEVGFGVGSNLQPPLESDARGESPAVAALPSTTPRTLVPRPGGADDGSNDWGPSAEIVAAVKRVSDKVMDASLAECDLFDLAYIAYTASAIAQWIPVSERLPNDLKATLVADEYGRVVAAEWDWNPVDGKRTCRWPCVTHWMTFPKSPIHRPDGGKQT